MAHAFTSLLLVDHDCFLKLTQDLEPHPRPVGRSKLSRSLIPTKKKLVEKSVIERLTEVKAVVISYNLWMSRKAEEIFSLTEHYCTSRDRKTPTLGYPCDLYYIIQYKEKIGNIITKKCFVINKKVIYVIKKNHNRKL